MGKKKVEENVGNRPMIALECVSGPSVTCCHVGKTNRITVGRTRVNNFHIKDPLISERHAILEWNGKEWTLEDLGSSNGTCVDGIPISEGVPVTLHNEDEISFGLETKVRVEIRPTLDPNLKTAEWLEAECEYLVQRLRRVAEKTEGKLREEAELAKKQLKLDLEISDSTASA